MKPRDWSGKAEPLNLFNIKADVLTLLSAYGVQLSLYRFCAIRPTGIIRVSQALCAVNRESP